MLSKLPNVGTSIFTVMSGLAQEQGAINLSQGFPDFEIDPLFSELVHKHMKSGANQYAPMPGLLTLRERISEKISTRFNRTYSPASEITITAGATQAIFTVVSALVNKGDKAIIFTPCYDSYAPSIELFGGEVIEIPLEGADFHINWEKVKNTVDDQTKLIIINSPHNPTGSILKKQDLEALQEIVLQNPQLYVISDEVYEHIVFDGEKHESACMYEALYKKSFVIFSFGKTFHATGWKVGYCLAPEELMKEFRKVHQFNVFCVNHPMQAALAEYMSQYNDYDAISAMYQTKRDLFLSLIKNTKFSFTPAKGTYFQLLNYENYSTETDLEYAKNLTIQKKLASIPLSPFYFKHTSNEKWLRFCFAKKDETLKKAAEILQTLS